MVNWSQRIIVFSNLYFKGTIETSNMMYIQWFWINSKWTACLWNTSIHLWGLNVLNVFILPCMSLTMWAKAIFKNYYRADDFFSAFLCWNFLRMYQNMLSPYYWKSVFCLISNCFLECGLDKKNIKTSQLNYFKCLVKISWTSLYKIWISFFFPLLLWFFSCRCSFQRYVLASQ